MNSRTLRAAVLLTLAIALAGTAAAQSPSAVLRGMVVDPAGKPLANVAVLVLSPAYQGQGQFVTDATGQFVFPALPVGVYELRADLPVHKSAILPGLVLRAGRTTILKIVLEPSETEEDQLVDKAPSVVDVATPKGGLVFDSSFLAALPLPRDLSAVVALAPGAVAEGRPYERAVSILGGSSRGQAYALDGGQATDPSTGLPIGNLNVDVMDQIEIISTGKPAAEEYGRGAAVQVISKSGGNTASGSLLFHMTGSGLSLNAYDEAAVRGLALEPTDRVTSLTDFSLNVGGPLWEDRAWYFLGARRASESRANPYDPGARLAGFGDGDPSLFGFDQTELMTYFKVTVNATDKIRYSGYFHWNNLYQPVEESSLTPDRAFDATWIRDHENSYATSHLVTLDLTPRTRIEIRGTYIERDLPLVSRDETQYSSFDFTRQVYWGAAPYNASGASRRMAGQAGLTSFLPRVLGADHTLKAGAAIEQADAPRNWWRSNPYNSLWYDYASGNPYYVDPTRSIGRLSLYAGAYAENIWNPKQSFRRVSAYVQDDLKAGRLALSLGLRFDYGLLFEPAQTRPALSYDYAPELIATDLGDNDLLNALIQRFTDAGLTSPFNLLTISYKKMVETLTFAPRAGLAFDVFGDGTTAFKLSFARDYDALWFGLYGSGHIFDPAVVEWDWYDLNGDKMMDLPGTDEYVLVAQPSQDKANNPFTYTDPAGVEHKISAPRSDTYTASLEREILPDLTVGAQFTLRRTSNLISLIDAVNGYDPTARDDKGLIWLPLSVTEPGRDGILGTSDDAKLTVYGLRADRPAPVYKYANIPEASQEYKAAVLTFDKRLSHGWQAAGSIVFSSFQGDLGADAASEYASGTRYTDPNGTTHSYGPLWLDRPIQVKLLGGVELPMGFYLGATFRFLSGAPYGRTLSRVYFPANYLGYGTRTPYVTVSAEASGVGRQPAFSCLDLRLQKGIKVGRAGRLDLYVDVFNLLGASALTTDEDPSGVLRSDLAAATYAASSSYGSILSYYGVRTIRLGAKLSF